MTTDIEKMRTRFCVVVPAFMAHATIADVVAGARRYAGTVVVVDDGSTDGTGAEAEAAGATVLRHERNLGKGVALNTGFEYARQHGFEFLITMDSSGRHNPADIPRFVDAYLRTGIPVLVGNRMCRPADLPFAARWANMLMSRLLSLMMRQYLPDTQCGFRLLKCSVIPFVSARAERYAAESELLLHVAARGIRMDSIPIKLLCARTKRAFHPVLDTIRFFVMLYHNRGLRYKRGT